MHTCTHSYTCTHIDIFELTPHSDFGGFFKVFIFKYADIKYICLCVSVWVCARECQSLQKPEEPDPLKLELQAIVSTQLGCCEPNLGTLQVLATAEQSLQSFSGFM